ncbi:MAG: DUF4864 domain-containing protein [Minwuia sp.]|uniref:DUF4864 domain-containing protein n=1 Tax=Minwuia sp. TaxID=2493630 RepID=UPI003A8A1686
MTLIRSLLAAMVLMAAAPAFAGPAEEIHAVIDDQIEAFRADDGDRAFSHASPGIQSKFRTPENFMEMVRTGYPQVYRPKVYEYQALEERGGLTIQEVFFFGEDGSAVVARYFMERNGDGVWKITGVDLRQAPELSV